MRRTICGAMLAAGMALAATGLATEAAAQATEAAAQAWRALPSPGTANERPSAAAAPDGSVRLVWIDRLAVRASRLSARAWSPAVTLDDRFGANGVALTIDRAGAATAAWNPGNGNVVAARDAGAGWGPWVDLSAQGFGGQQVDMVVDAGGAVTAVWLFALDAIQAARFENGAWSPAVTLDTRTQGVTPRLAVDGAGVVTAVWFDIDGDFPNQTGVLSAARFVGGAWRAPVAVSGTETGAFGQLATAAAPDGTVTVVWTADQAVRAAVFTGGAWAAPVDLAAQRGSVPDVVVDAQGRATAAWISSTASGDAIAAARRDPSAAGSAGWSAPQDLGRGGVPALAVDGRGAVTAVWIGPRRVRSSRFKDGAWTAPLDVSAEDASNAAPTVVVDDAGVATAVWLSSAGDRFVLQAATFDPAEVVVAPVPTLSQWALTALALLLAAAAAHRLRRPA